MTQNLQMDQLDRDALFLKLTHYFFLKFCMKLERHGCSKVVEPDLGVKISFVQERGKMTQKYTYLRLSEN